MTTLRKYVDVVKAEMDKSLLEAAGIPAFIAGENSAAIGYGSILAEIHLQVQDADVDRARQVLQDNQEATPLSDDFIPPAAPSSPDDSVPKAASQRELETVDPDTRRAVFSAVVAVVFVLAMFAAFTWWKNSHSATAYYQLGFAEYVKGDLDGSIADYTKAIELNFRHVGQAYDGRGLAKQAKGDLDGAIADYNIAVTLDPKGKAAYGNRGIAKWSKGDLDGALADYGSAIGLDPKDALIYYSRSFVKRSKNDLGGAIADLDKAIELDPKNINAYYGRGVIHYDERDWNNALSDFRTSSVLKPAVSKSNIFQNYPHIRIWMTRAKLGERAAATDELKQYLLTRTIGKPGDWPSTIVRFLTGDVSESDFLKAADSSNEKQTRNQRCEAYFYPGTLRLLDGDKSVAADYFKKCLETEHKDYYEYQSAAAELEAVKQ